MNSNKITFLFLLFFVCALGQQKITVDAIYNGEFRAKGMDELQSLKNTNQYTVLNFDQQTRSLQIDLFDFASLKKVSTLIDTKDYPKLSSGIDSYSFSSDEKSILIANNSNQIYRHSFTADYFLYNLESKELTKILEQVQEPTFSPDGKKIAYAKENNLLFMILPLKLAVRLLPMEEKTPLLTELRIGFMKKNLLL